MGYSRTKKTNIDTGEHLTMPGHSLGNMTVTILAKVESEDVFYRKERETYLIQKFNTFYRGLNLRP